MGFCLRKCSISRYMHNNYFYTPEARKAVVSTNVTVVGTFSGVFVALVITGLLVLDGVRAHSYGQRAKDWKNHCRLLSKEIYTNKLASRAITRIWDVPGHQIAALFILLSIACEEALHLGERSCRVSPRMPLACVLFTISPKWRACSQAILSRTLFTGRWREILKV